MDEGGDFPNEAKENRKAGRAADDESAVNARDGHDAHVFAVSRIRRRARETGEDIREAVGEEGAVQTGIFDEVAADDVARDEKMSQVFGQDDEDGRENHHDGREMEARLVKCRKRKPGRLGDV